MALFRSTMLQLQYYNTAIIRKYNDDKAIRMSFSTSPSILELIVKKGSIAIDGISLTVTD
ncbi:MAG: hypothetical protein II330_01245, partial [Clostridia bacterium]|nr:hypothetical protein [Clostridia bacterium]